MAPRSEEEKRRRKEEYLERKEARRLAKEKKQQEDAKRAKEKEANEAAAESTDLNDLNDDNTNTECMFDKVPEDAIRCIICFLSARELGVLSMSSRAFNYIMAEARVAHLYSRLMTRQTSEKNSTEKTSCTTTGMITAPIEMCENEADVRKLIQKSLQDSPETGRLVTRKSKRGVKTNAGDADEYIAFARFIEEAVSGHARQKFLGKKPSSLPPIVNGRFASVSPEHSLTRIGGDGVKSGAGGSGCASWGVGKRGQLGHGKRKDEKEPKLLLGGIGYGIRIVQVSAGGGLVRVAHSLLLTSTGKVLSFGNAQYGQLGHGYDSGKQLPDVLRPNFVEELNHLECTCVSAGEIHSAVATSDGDVYTWGDGFCGQLGLGDKRPKLIPEQVTAGGLEDECVLSVTCGARHTLCVTEEGEAFSFGLGHYGVLGRSFTPYQYYSDAMLANLGTDDDGDNNEQPAGALEIDAIDDTMRENLNLLANLTLDDKSDQCIPKIISALQGINIVGASAGHRHSIFLDSEGCIYTCGTGYGGALGHGDYVQQDYPMKVMSLADKNIKMMQISAGVDISMAVSTTGDVYSWGKTSGGRIGQDVPHNNLNMPRQIPLKDDNGNKISCVDAECGFVHSLIVGCDGSLHMCGGVGVDGADDGQAVDVRKGIPSQVSNVNIWHRIPEPSEHKEQVKWKKYGKYELKGRRAMMAEK